MITVPKVDGGAAAPETPEAVQPRRPRQPVEVRAKQSVALAEFLAATRGLPPAERAAMQRRLLADPRAWDASQWLD